MSHGGKLLQPGKVPAERCTRAPPNTTSHPTPRAANALLPRDPPPAALRPSCAPPLRPPPLSMILPPAPCAYLPLRVGKVLPECVHGLLQHALLQQGSVKCMLGKSCWGRDAAAMARVT